MTVKQYKQENPNKAFILKSSHVGGGHVNHVSCAMYSMVEQVYDSEIQRITKTKSGLTRLYVDYNFHTNRREVL